MSYKLGVLIFFFFHVTFVHEYFDMQPHGLALDFKMVEKSLGVLT